jgi:hypothetical protein
MQRPLPAHSVLDYPRIRQLLVASAWTYRFPRSSESERFFLALILKTGISFPVGIGVRCMDTELVK